MMSPARRPHRSAGLPGITPLMGQPGSSRVKSGMLPKKGRGPLAAAPLHRHGHVLRPRRRTRPSATATSATYAGDPLHARNVQPVEGVRWAMVIGMLAGEEVQVGNPLGVEGGLVAAAGGAGDLREPEAVRGSSARSNSSPKPVPVPTLFTVTWSSRSRPTMSRLSMATVWSSGTSGWLT